MTSLSRLPEQAELEVSREACTAQVGIAIQTEV